MKNLLRNKNRILLAAVIPVLVFLLGGCASAELYTIRDQAVLEYQQGSYERAGELFNEALSYGNGEVAEAELDILKYRAECELRCREFEKAKETYGILAQLDESGENQSVYSELQEQFDKMNELSEAYDLMQEGKYKEAYEANDRLAGLGGDAVEAAAWFNKAVCAEHLANWAEAAELFGDYVAIYPNDEEAEKEYNFCRSR